MSQVDVHSEEYQEFLAYKKQMAAQQQDTAQEPDQQEATPKQEAASEHEKYEETEPSDVSPPADERRELAKKIVREEASWAFGLGLIPIPIIDLAALTAVEVRMIRRIGEVYGRKFSDATAKNVFLSLAAGGGSTFIGVGVLSQAFKYVPFLNIVGSVMSVSLTAMPFHFALGQWLIDSLEADPNGDLPKATFRSYISQKMGKKKQEEDQTPS